MSGSLWRVGQAPETIYHKGRVAINSDHPEQRLSICGNMKVTGHVINPCDKRFTTASKELDPRQQLENISRLKVYEYSYDNEYAEVTGRTDGARDTGLIAQDVGEVLPEAVRDTGDVALSSGRVNQVLGINKDRIYMENVGAVKELCKVTDELETRMNILERISKRLSAGNTYGNNMRAECSSTCSASSQSCSLSCESIEEDNEISDVTTETSEQHDSFSGTVSGEVPGLLNNKRLIHASIIVLVLVIAFCLVSVTVLFILEQRKSQSNTIAPPTALPIPSGNSTRSDADVTGTTVPTRSTKGTTVPTGAADLTPTFFPPHATPLAKPRCVSEPEQCPIHCCFLPPESGTTPLYRHDPCHNGFRGCPTAHISPTDDPKLLPQDWDEPANVHPPQKNDANNQSANNDDPPHPADRYQILDYDYDMDSSLVVDSPNRRKRSALVSNVTDRADIVLLETNSTLDDRYCTNEDCRRGHGANFTYSVPLSPAFPYAYVTIMFSLGDNLVINLCNEFTVYECVNYDEADEGQLMTHTWNLPIGYYALSFYKIRVTHIDTENACYLNQSEQGKAFADYYLRFERLRHESCTSDEILRDFG